MRSCRRQKLLPRSKRSLILILVGFFFFALAGFLKSRQEFFPKVSLPKTPGFIEKIEEGDLPSRILIPKVKIDLPIFEGKVANDRWEISEEGVSYLMGSAIPGRKGRVVIYGHNKSNQFGPIRWLEKEDEIKVVNKKKEEFIYEVLETKIVSPHEIDEVLSPSQEPTLTLYTCTGFLDRQRFIVTAKLGAGF